MSNTTEIIDRIEREMAQNKSSGTKKSRLLITCPDCYLEDTLNHHFDGPAFWLTTLGGVIDMADAFFIAQIEFAIRQYHIEEIDLVLSTHCQTLNRLTLEQDTDVPARAMDETLQSQLDSIREIPLVANQLDEGKMIARAFLYDEDNSGHLREI